MLKQTLASRASMCWVASALIWMTVFAGLSATLVVTKLEPLWTDPGTATTEAGRAQQEALRYGAGEVNRAVFRVYAWANASLAFVLVVSSVLGRFSAATIALSIAVDLFAVANLTWLTPALVELGRSASADAPDTAGFHRLHRVSVLGESAKVLALLIVSGLLLRGQGARARGRSADSR